MPAACAAERLSFRGVVVAPVPVTCGPSATACSAKSVPHAARAGRFSVPLDDAFAAKLSAQNQQLLTAALAGFDCSSAQDEVNDASSYYVACGDATGPGQDSAYLLGPVIVAGAQIVSATALKPNPKSGQVAPVVQLSLSPSGQAAWTRYTSAHNANGAQDTAAVSTCGPNTTPCADYVGFTLDGKVISSPVNLEPITGAATQIAGSFTLAAVRQLAAQLRHGGLAVPLRVDSIRSVH